MTLLETALIALSNVVPNKNACKSKPMNRTTTVLSIIAGAVTAFVFVVATSPKLQSVLGLSL